MSFGPGETDPSQSHRGDGAIAAAPQPPCVTFERRELDHLRIDYEKSQLVG